MQYAPVIIPTLNRDAHLKRCLDSLAANSVAAQTDLYISVDYPPAPKYVPGYERVKALLQDYDFSRFKSHHILYQSENLGPSANSRLLERVVSEFSDAVIYTEDDNEFSPNFLEYLNKGFEEFSDDERVVFLCGSPNTEWYYADDANVTMTKLLAAYGMGYRLSRRARFNEQANEYLLDRRNWTIRNFARLYRRNGIMFWMYISGILCSEKNIYWEDSRHIHFCDTPTSIYMHYSDYGCICPRIPKSRTFGNDGSGVNMPAMTCNREVELDKAHTFEYVYPKDFSFNPDNYRLGDEYMRAELKKSTCVWLKIFTAWIMAVMISLFKSRSLPLFIRRSALRIKGLFS